MTIGILIPTLNASTVWEECLKKIDIQTASIKRKIILDSGSNDNTVSLAKQYGFDVITINKKDFDHGYGRVLLAQEAGNVDILLYLTQDCILADADSISKLVTAFDDEKVGVAYGRQLPRSGAKLLEAHARNFNYPGISTVKSFADRERLGIRVASCSNSFAAYRTSAFHEIGGFPRNSIFGEDVILGGQMLIKGWKISYVANAEAYHSHNYTIKEEFKRYFDIGVFHKTNDFLLKEFGSASGEGLKYVKSELNVILKNNIMLLPKMIGSTLAKWVGYKLGLNFNNLPASFRESFSMHKSYWHKQTKNN